MNRRITTKDNLFLAMPFLIMGLLYWSSSMAYETQSLTSPLEIFLESKPFESFLSQFQFTYGGSVISIQNSDYFSFIEFFIRKAAHFFSYFAIGFFWVLGLRKRVREDWLMLILSGLLCIGYASFDELRQNFNPGRTALMADVLLDTVGAIVGIGMSWMLVQKRIIR